MVAWSILVSAQGPLVLGLGLKGLGLRAWGQGLTIHPHISYVAVIDGFIIIKKRWIRDLQFYIIQHIA